MVDRHTERKKGDAKCYAFCFLSPEPLTGHDEYAANGPLSVQIRADAERHKREVEM